MVTVCCLEWGVTSGEDAVPSDGHHQFHNEQGESRQPTCTVSARSPLTSTEVAPKKLHPSERMRRSSCKWGVYHVTLIMGCTVWKSVSEG